MHQSWSRIN